MLEGIIAAIGNTPLVKLTRIFKDLHFDLYAKLEAFNPGGSMKDRPAFNIIRRALETGEIGPGTVVIESSSGNMGIGLAQACSYYGLHFICVVDAKTTLQNIRLLKAYGAEVELVDEPDPKTGEFLQARIERVKLLTRVIKNSFWPNQYANIHNPMAHYQTVGEVTEVLGKGIDYFFCSVSTCGTLRGCAEYVQMHGMKSRIFAVDAVGSVIWSGSPGKKRLIPGHGAAVIPQLFRPGLADECIHMTDLDCVVGCRRLAQREAILAGGSSGAIISAVDMIKHTIPRGSVCIVILADRGERYLDTIYSDAWVTEHFGDVAHLWQDTLPEQHCEMSLAGGGARVSVS